MNNVEGLDEIDRHILRILAQDPRIPYSDIANRLEEEGYEMSGEGIRYRVSKLFQTTSILLLTAPKEHGWEVIRLFLNVTNEPDAKAQTFNDLTELGFWLVSRGIGSFDLYAVATVESNLKADELVSKVREIETVAKADYALETDRETHINYYLSFD